MELRVTGGKDKTASRLTQADDKGNFAWDPGGMVRCVKSVHRKYTTCPQNAHMLCT